MMLMFGGRRHHRTTLHAEDLCMLARESLRGLVEEMHVLVVKEVREKGLVLSAVENEAGRFTLEAFQHGNRFLLLLDYGPE